MAEEEAKYSILWEVGRGSYGVVYEAVANRTKRRVAVKRMHCNAPGNAELAPQELRALRSIRRQHRNVLQLEECVLQHGRRFQPLADGEPGSPPLLVETCLKGRRRAGPLAAVRDGAARGRRRERVPAGAPPRRAARRALHAAAQRRRGLPAPAPHRAPRPQSRRHPGGQRACWAPGRGTYICQGEELIPLGEALLENPNLKLQIPLKNKESMPEDLCQLLHHMLASNPKERLDASQLEVQIQQISYGKKRKHSGS